ncbi:MAG: PAS domain-containing protein [Thermoguttaceae bacterium]
MSKKQPHPDDVADLRRRAEEMARALEAQSRETLSPAEAGRLLHELQVHQIELEMQNEELRRAQAELEASRERYFDLYDLAPVGYVTLSEQGLILEANLTAATLLGVARGALVNQPITGLILKEDQDTYYLHRKQVFETGERRAYELRMVRKDGSPFWVQFEAAAAQDADGAPVSRVVLSNITERKFQEDERALTAELIALVNTPGDFRERMSDLTASLQGWSECEAVGVRLRAGDDYPYYETRGFPSAFVHEENHLCAYGPDGKILRDGEGNPVLECMCGNILCGRFDPTKPFFTAHGSFWSNNTTALLASTTEADRQSRTRNRCNGEGYESVALIPLRAGQQVFGLLQFNDHRPDRFTSGRIAQFERTADSLANVLLASQAEESLKKSQALLAESEIIAGWGSWEFDVVRGISHISEGLKQMSGLPRDYPLRVPYQPATNELVHPDDAPMFYENMERTIREGVPWDCEYRIIRNDNRQVCYRRSRGEARRDETGRIVRVVGADVDITERKQAEEVLRQSEEFKLAILDSVPSHIAVLDLEGTIVEVNGPWQRFAQENPTSAGAPARNTGIGVNYLEVCRQGLGESSENAMAAHDGIKAVLEGRMPRFALEYPCHSPNEQRWFYMVVTPLGKDRQGAVVSHSIITETKEAEEALRKSEVDLNRAQAIAHVGSWSWDIPSDMVSWSAEMYRIYGVEPETFEHTLNGVARLIHPDDLPRQVHAVEALLQGRSFEPFEYRVIRPDGGIRVVQVFTADVERNASGQVTRMFGVAQDITERKRTEEERRQLEAQVLSAQKLESLGVLAGGIAHDFNNILGGIRMFADVLRTELPASTRASEMVAEIRKATQRGSELTRQILTYAGEGPLHPEPLDLTRLVADMKKMLEVVVSKRADLAYRLAYDMATVHADAAQIRQVLMNLVVNASEALGDKDGEILISTSMTQVDGHDRVRGAAGGNLAEGTCVCLEVADTGCGMDKATVEKIFDLFYSTKFAGRGLGLASVYGIVRAHKGAIQVSSEPGKGSTFRVLLPAAEPTPLRSAKSEPAKDALPRGSGTVLVVDDEDMIRMGTQALFESFGFTVLAASNGQGAVDIYRQHRGDIVCVILDLTMPKMSGEEVLQELLSIDPDVRVVLTSGYTAQTMAQRLGGQKVFAFVQKPDPFDTIIQRLVSVLAKGE